MRLSPRLFVAAFALLSTLALGCEQADTGDPQGTSQSAAASSSADGQKGPHGQGAPSLAQALLRASIEELEASGSLNAAIQDIKQSLEAPKAQDQAAHRALDQATAAQLRDGVLDLAALSPSIAAAEQAHQAADAALAQALDDARALLSAEQRQQVVERVKSKLPTPGQASPQGSAQGQPPGPPPGGEQGMPSQGEAPQPPPDGMQGEPPPGAQQPGPQGMNKGPGGADPLLEGIELSDEQKAKLQELMPPPGDKVQPNAAHIAAVKRLF
jgi:Spy/CpxP family protein refolding chaperone